jgi:transcriptional regulator with XRE-family HTH domain
MITKNTPIPVIRAIKKLGNDLADARKRRRIPMELAAQRAGICRTTLSRIEKGDEGVSLGAYVKVLFILGMIDRVSQLVDVTSDLFGLDLESENLPKRIRISRKEKG